MPFTRDAYLSLERKLDRYLGPPLVRIASLILGRRRPAGGEPSRILLIKLHGIGNVVLLIPVIRQLRKRFPTAEIDFLSFRSNAGILESVRELSRRHYLDRGTPWGLLASTLAAIPRLRGRRYDLAIDFDQFAHFSALATLLSGAGHRIGYRNPTLSRHRAYDTPVVYLDMAHVSRTFARLARTAGAPSVAGVSRRIELDEADRREASSFLAASGIAADRRWAILHPGSSENLKLRRWPEVRFAELGDRLSGELGCGIVVSGGGGESDLVRSVCALMKQPAADASGKLSLRGFAALCEMASFVVSNDTATVHVASAMGTPVVGLYGPNTPFLYGPLGEDDLVYYSELPCSPCLCNITSKLSECRRALCMESITVDAVFEGIRARYFKVGDAAT